MGTDQTKSDYMCLEIKYDYSAVVPNIYALVHGVKHCSSDAQCPSSYCQHPGPSGECHTCGDACCLTDKDCPGSYCANDPTKMPPYFCHGGNTALEEVAPAAPFCLHAEDVVDHKCFEACNADGKKFASKGITTAGKCPAKYSTIDKVKTVEQCPDGVTNLRYCQATKLNVTISTKGQAGVVSLMEASPFCLHAEDVIDHKCFEACNADGKTFASKGITTAGKCPAKYSTIDKVKTVEQCPDGVTNLRYCQATKLNVTISTKGQAGVALMM